MIDLSTLGIDTLVQMASLVVYVLAIGWALVAAFDIRHSHHPAPTKYVAAALTALTAATAVVFIVAQIPWLIEQQWRVMSTAEAMAWLIYDWLNGLAHLATILVIRSFMRWRLPTPCQFPNGVCPSAHLARRAHATERGLSGVATEIEQLQARIDRLAETSASDTGAPPNG